MEERETRVRQISLLVQTYYNEFKFLQSESLESLVNKALDRYLDTDLSIEQINEEFAKIVLKKREESKSEKNFYEENTVKANHKEIYAKLEELVKLLNKAGIDYQLAGALCGYIKYGQESDRCHTDIDININEKDIDKLRSVCESMNLKFADNRFNSSKVLNDGKPVGEHEVIATDSNNDFHIGAFPFERLADGTIITKSYYHDSNNNPCSKEDIISSQLAELIFENEPVNFRGEPIYITSPEYIYVLKAYTNSEKDKHDLKFLDDKIDRNKLKSIQELSKTDRVTQHNLVTNKQPENNDKAVELEEMLYTTTDLEKDMIKANKKDKTMQFKKVNPNMKNISGSISIVSIILALLVVFAVLLIGLIIYTIVK